MLLSPYLFKHKTKRQWRFRERRAKKDLSNHKIPLQPSLGSQGTNPFEDARGITECYPFITSIKWAHRVAIQHDNCPSLPIHTFQT